MMGLPRPLPRPQSFGTWLATQQPFVFACSAGRPALLSGCRLPRFTRCRDGAEEEEVRKNRSFRVPTNENKPPDADVVHACNNNNALPMAMSAYRRQQ